MKRFVLFAYGFRPFFLAAGAYAGVAMAGWLLIYRTGQPVLGGLPPSLWHGHEMLYGFIGAAIAGFLLTAVPSWTGARGFAGAPLIGVFLVWLLGRVAFAASNLLPVSWLAVCELTFLPALALLIAPPLLRARNRNTPLLLVLLFLWLTDAVFLLALAREDPGLASTSLRAGIGLVLLLVTVIGGRIVPAFTANALRSRGVPIDIRTRAWVEWAAIGAMAVSVVIDMFAPHSMSAAAVAGIAAIAQALRLAGWQTRRTFSEPIVWVLHAAYAWLPIGLALKAIFLASGAWWAAPWLHALTIGVAATMILAVMTRAALGHAGRPLVVAPAIVVAYVLMLAATLARVAGPALAPAQIVWTISAAGVLWILAFLLFVIVYAPILAAPRADGRPG